MSDQVAVRFHIKRDCLFYLQGHVEDNEVPDFLLKNTSSESDLSRSRVSLVCAKGW